MTSTSAAKPLKIACVAISEMGHFIPMSHIVDILQKRGHNVFFITQSDAYNDHKASKIMTQIGCSNQVFTDDGMTREEFFKPPKMKDNHQHRWFDLFQGLVKKEIEKIKPDLIVCDFYTRVGVTVADELGIPCIINTPGMIDIFHHFGVSGVVDPTNGSTCCGMICFSQPFKHWMIQKFFDYAQPQQAIFFRSWNRRVIMFNSFWGLDPAVPIPPHWHMVGPLSLTQTDLLPMLEKKDPELFKWMNEAQEKNIKVVYVSLGSVCRWADWEIKVMYDGLKKLGCRVVWSLKLEPPEKHPNFWFSPWVPQIELLAHPALKAGLTHCGHGGTLEFIGAGVPIVALPHFGDQPKNAVELEKRKIAVILYNRGDTALEQDLAKLAIYPEPVFNAQQVHDAFKEVLSNEIYDGNMKKLQLISQTMGGRDQVAKICENTVLVGSEHLIDEVSRAQHSSLSWCVKSCSMLFILMIFATLVTLSVLWIIDEVGSPSQDND